MKIYYHNDMDGESAAALIYLNSPGSKIDCIPCDYTKPLDFTDVKKNERIYILDLSLNEQNALALMDLMMVKTANVVWIDHHVSSTRIREQSCYGFLKKIPGLIVSEAVNGHLLCGAALTYHYLNINNTNTEDFITNKILLKMPMSLVYINDYDTWTLEHEPKTSYFKLGIELRAHTPTDYVWQRLLKNNSTDFMNQLIADGTIVKTYIDQENKRYFDQFNYITEVDGIRCVAVNKQANSWIFGKLYGEYPLHMPYVFNGEKYIFTLFSKDENIDCSLIAKKFGGGGHKGAAGFTLDHNPFIKISEVGD